MTLAAIWIRDLRVAMNTLRPADDRTLGAIADLLGFERAAAAPPPPPPEPEQLPPDETRPGDAGAESAPVQASDLPVTVQDLSAIAPRQAAGGTDAATKPLVLQVATPGVPPSPVPLLSPLAGRFIAQELVVSSRFGPEPDLIRLVDDLARYEIPQPLPLQERRTLARGVQVLVDDAEGMEPFTADQQRMVEVVRRLAGDALVEVRHIYEVPDPADPVQPWQAPPLGVPVLALTDLGLAGRVERGAAELVAGWQLIADTLAARGSSLVALLPHPPERWPAALVACMDLVPWDRSTTTVRARRARSKGPGQ